MRMLYLTLLQSPLDDLFQSQVTTLLLELKRRYGTKIDIFLVAACPIVSISRRGLLFFFDKYREREAHINRTMGDAGVHFKLIPIYFPFLLRWGSYVGIGLLFLVGLLVLPPLLLIVRNFRPDVIHCRSYPATVIALVIKALKTSRKPSVVFDMRGLYPEEGVVHRRWAVDSLTFRLWKVVESKMLALCDKIVVLSDAFRDHVISITEVARTKTASIPASVDLNVFSRGSNGCDLDSRHAAIIDNWKDKIIFSYHGGLNSWHSPSALAKVFRVIRQCVPDARMMVITGFDHNVLREVFSAEGLAESDFLLLRAGFSEMPSYLSKAKYALVPAGPIDSEPNQARLLIYRTMTGLKVSEALAMGLPIVANEIIGGLRTVMASHTIGITFSLAELHDLPTRFTRLANNRDTVSEECRRYALETFNIEKAATLYYSLYADLR